MIHIAFCTDTNYVMPAGVAITSICENNVGDQITFHLVITDEGKSCDEVDIKVRPLVDIINKYGKISQIYRIKKELLVDFECSGANYISTSAFARIFIPELLPSNINKVLYLDCDIVCNGNIEELWNLDLEDFPIGGAIDCNGTLAGFREKIKTPLNIPYVNSGVLLFNLDCWRRNKYVDKVKECALVNNFSLLDQDTLNYFFQDRILILPIKYNLQTLFIFGSELQWHVEYKYLDEIRAAIECPIIVHYLTSNKPWKNAYCPYRDIWEKYKNITIWKDMPRQELLTRFDRTEIYQEVMDTYWSDGNLFIKGLSPYLRFFKSAIKLKNKSKFINCSSKMLNFFAFILEKIYNMKTRK